MQLSGKRLKAAVSDFGHLAGLPFLLILDYTSLQKLWKQIFEQILYIIVVNVVYNSVHCAQCTEKKQP